MTMHSARGENFPSSLGVAGVAAGSSAPPIVEGARLPERVAAIFDVGRGARCKQPRGRGGRQGPLGFGLVDLALVVRPQALRCEDVVLAVDDQAGVIALQRVDGARCYRARSLRQNRASMWSGLRLSLFQDDFSQEARTAKARALGTSPQSSDMQGHAPGVLALSVFLRFPA
jgi:hypothetical protein